MTTFVLFLPTSTGETKAGTAATTATPRNARLVHLKHHLQLYLYNTYVYIYTHTHSPLPWLFSRPMNQDTLFQVIQKLYRNRKKKVELKPWN